MPYFDPLPSLQAANLTMPPMIPPVTDKVFIDTLHLATANIGSDCWGKSRPQPLELSVYLHLRPSFLDKSGASGDVVDSVHYGHLTKAISALVDSKYSVRGKGSEVREAFGGIHGLANEVAEEALKLAADAALEVRIVVNAPNLILLAGDFVVDTTISRASHGGGDGDDGGSMIAVGGRVVEIKEITIPVIIGVNPPERLAKQKVVTDLVIYETTPISHTEYQRFVAELAKVSC